MSLVPQLQEFDHGGYRHPGLDWLTFYCLIPKNASSWISQVCAHNGWIRGRLQECPKQQIDELIVVLRDPVDRWVAGVAQYLVSFVLHSHWFDRSEHTEGYSGDYIPGKCNYTSPIMTAQQFVSHYNDLTERLLFEQIAFDDHTQTQCWFVDHFQPSHYTWFYLNESFERNFVRNYRNLPLTVPADCDRNHGQNHENIRVISEFLHDRIGSRPYLRNSLERYYRGDLDLIQKADFRQFDPGMA